MPWFFGRRSKKDEEEYDESASESSGSWESYYTTSSDEENDDAEDSDYSVDVNNDNTKGAKVDTKDESQSQDDLNDSRSSYDMSLKDEAEDDGDSSVSVTAEVIPDGESIDEVFTTDEEITSEEFSSVSDHEIALDHESEVSQHSASDAADEAEKEENVNNETGDDETKRASDVEEKKAKEESNDEEQATSFWEKLSLLLLAAEHDRVDILKAVLVDDEADKGRLLHEGIPPLHIAISYGSINATQSLLRMGADPSIRPNIEQFEAFQKEQPQDTRVNIPKVERFDDVSAWELAFGNGIDIPQPKKTTSWLFGSSDSSELEHDVDSLHGSRRAIRPVDMPPSKREGIRHAFTAESLRCIGGDEVDRLKQLLDSGMPPSIDIGDKDLYSWAVEMGALKCEELLRSSEEAKHKIQHDQSFEEEMESSMSTVALDTVAGQAAEFGIVHRTKPGQESTIELMNRLDELESLAAALSTSLDNLAEEVSVCHGLLLMGGGASALASHVKSLKQKRSRREQELDQVRQECMEASNEFSRLVAASGEVGREIAEMADTKLVAPKYTRSFSIVEPSSHEEEISQMQQLRAQIGATENKNRKLRASIADLSEESAREMEEVERRGLTGGINLVRGIREELRDIEFAINEAKSLRAVYKTKIQMIKSKVTRLEGLSTFDAPQSVEDRKVEEQTSTSVLSEAGSSSQEDNPTSQERDEMDDGRENLDPAGDIEEKKSENEGANSSYEYQEEPSELTYDEGDNSLIADDTEVKASAQCIESDTSGTESLALDSDKENGVAPISVPRDGKNEVVENNRDYTAPVAKEEQVVKLPMNSRFWQFVAPDPNYEQKVLSATKALSPQDFHHSNGSTKPNPGNENVKPASGGSDEVAVKDQKKGFLKSLFGSRKAPDEPEESISEAVIV